MLILHAVFETLARRTEPARQLATPSALTLTCIHRYAGAEITALITDWHVHKGVASLVAHDKSYVQVKHSCCRGRLVMGHHQAVGNHM
eukprot:scaffold217361_cov37-Tisochrysis_lutea.AAC.3